MVDVKYMEKDHKVRSKPKEDVPDLSNGEDVLCDFLNCQPLVRKSEGRTALLAGPPASPLPPSPSMVQMTCAALTKVTMQDMSAMLALSVAPSRDHVGNSLVRESGNMSPGKVTSGRNPQE